MQVAGLRQQAPPRPQRSQKRPQPPRRHVGPAPPAARGRTTPAGAPQSAPSAQARNAWRHAADTAVQRGAFTRVQTAACADFSCLFLRLHLFTVCLYTYIFFITLNLSTSRDHEVAAVVRRMLPASSIAARVVSAAMDKNKN